jgi:hypothetical protein
VSVAWFVKDDCRESMINWGPKRLNDPDMRGAERAIHRAALKARERARRFGHGIVIYEKLNIPVVENNRLRLNEVKYDHAII